MKPDLIISPLTLGTAQLGLDYGIANAEGKPDEAKAFSIISTALDNGITCIDTAAAYGDSEKVIGNYFRSVSGKRENIVIVTKLRLGQINPGETDRSIMRSLERSAENLATGHIDILLLHDPKEYITHGREISKCFQRMVSEGMVGMAGASCYCIDDIKGMLEDPVFSVFQIPVNLLDKAVNSPEEISSLRGKIIFARSIFLQGLFFIDPHRLKGKMKEAGIFINRIRSIAGELNITVNELALRYVMSLGFADSMVIGADNPAHLKQNIDLIRYGPLPGDLVTQIGDRLKGAPEWLLKPYMWNTMTGEEASSGS
ncbi:MAG: aldo/keto reductase [Bacteroidales bacterium]|nr:aldo/keto reductase [Bacteroidales bacterium]